MIIASFTIEAVSVAISAIAVLCGGIGVFAAYSKLRKERAIAEKQIESYKRIGLASISKKTPATSIDEHGNIVIRLKDGKRLIVTIEKDSDGKSQVKIRPEVKS